jgi:hypothetical protein
VAKILSERKLNSNFTEKLKLYLVILGVTNPAVSWSGLRAFSACLWWRSGIGNDLLRVRTLLPWTRKS